VESASGDKLAAVVVAPVEAVTWIGAIGLSLSWSGLNRLNRLDWLNWLNRLDGLGWFVRGGSRGDSVRGAGACFNLGNGLLGAMHIASHDESAAAIVAPVEAGALVGAVNISSSWLDRVDRLDWLDNRGDCVRWASASL